MTNFRGIELRDFAAEVARLSLTVAEFQCDVLYRGKQLALAEFLPLQKENWIVQGNALRLDWLSVCPPNGTGVRLHGDDLFATPLEQPEIDFENEGGETYLCSNPPYLGSTWQTSEQKAELQAIFEQRTPNWRSLDYVSGWFLKAADYGTRTNAAAAFVATNSICQGQQVPILWPLIFNTRHEIAFAHTSFKWANLASHKAGVAVVIVGISNHVGRVRRLYSASADGDVIARDVENINAYLVPGRDVIVQKSPKPLSGVSEMTFGSKPVDGGNLLLSQPELQSLQLSGEDRAKYIKPIFWVGRIYSGKGEVLHLDRR